MASLFGLDQEASQGNESFQYTAPKQPRKISNSGRTTTAEKSTLRFCYDVEAELNMSFCLFPSTSYPETSSTTWSPSCVIRHSSPSLQIVRSLFLIVESLSLCKTKHNSKSSEKLFCHFCLMCSMNGQYVKQGKLGAAVLGNHTTKEVGALLTGHLFQITGLTFGF